MKLKSLNCNQIIVDSYLENKEQISEFLSQDYKYTFVNSRSLKNYSINLKSYTIFIIKKNHKAKVRIFYDNISKNLNKVCQVENIKSKISISGGPVELLIAGTKKSSIKTKKINFLNINELYKVDKPWGGETWINGRHPNYAFKIIKLNSGFKTSLQFHKKKIETNFLYKGSGILHFSALTNSKTNLLKDPDIFTYKVQSMSTIFVKKYSIHRIEALTNLVLYEISTPHLDDVIRIKDDTNRRDGLIKKEHK